MTPLLSQNEALRRFKLVLHHRFGVPMSVVHPTADVCIAYAGSAKSDRQVLDAALKYAADENLTEVEGADS